MRVKIADMRDWLVDYVSDNAIDISDDGNGANMLVKNDLLIALGLVNEFTTLICRNIDSMADLEEVVEFLQDATDAEIAEAYVLLKFNNTK